MQLTSALHTSATSASSDHPTSSPQPCTHQHSENGICGLESSFSGWKGCSKGKRKQGAKQRSPTRSRALRMPAVPACHLGKLLTTLQILLGIMSGAFGLAGFYFGRKPTTATSEAEVSVAESSMPWQVDHDHEDHSKHFKYQYHPKGDTSQMPRNAPSALNTVIIPNVTLPKVG